MVLNKYHFSAKPGSLRLTSSTVLGVAVTWCVGQSGATWGRRAGDTADGRLSQVKGLFRSNPAVLASSFLGKGHKGETVAGWHLSRELGLGMWG